MQESHGAAGIRTRNPSSTQAWGPKLSRDLYIFMTGQDMG